MARVQQREEGGGETGVDVLKGKAVVGVGDVVTEAAHGTQGAG